MTDKHSDFPRDLRGMSGGCAEDKDGIRRSLFFPLKAYANLLAASNETERAISDPATRAEDMPALRRGLEKMQRELTALEHRIREHFRPRAPGDGSGPPTRIDHGAKSKIEKGLEDAKAGKYDPERHSQTLKAVFSAFDFLLKNGRMPSHAELKNCGYNDQQATDAGKWIETADFCEAGGESEPLRLHKPKRGRPAGPAKEK